MKNLLWISPKIVLILSLFSISISMLLTTWRASVRSVSRINCWAFQKCHPFICWYNTVSQFSTWKLSRSTQLLQFVQLGSLSRHGTPCNSLTHPQYCSRNCKKLISVLNFVWFIKSIYFIVSYINIKLGCPFSLRLCRQQCCAQVGIYGPNSTY